MSVETPEGKKALVLLKGRVERTRAEMKALKEDEKALFDEAKSKGYDVKLFKQALSIIEKRDKDPEKFELEKLEQELYVEVLS